MIEPLGYLDMIHWFRNAHCVLTDSGGFKRRFAGVLCMTLRSETEWVELLQSGANRLFSGARSSLQQELNEFAAPPDACEDDSIPASRQIVGILERGALPPK